ncbi:MAG: YbaK/EbsC family protein [Anaerolineaceae bacterium]|nr:YbaK/EbsC family protein [Anaerolineaceae bacterium]
MNNTTDLLPPVARFLDGLHTPYRLFVHSGSIHSLEQAAEERNQQPEQVVRSILFRLSAGEYMMVLVAGPAQISWPVLRKTVGVSRLTMADPEEVLAFTGYVTGTVSPFIMSAVPGEPLPLRILVDEKMKQLDEISLGSGLRGTAVIMRTDDLFKALGSFEWIELSDPR